MCSNESKPWEAYDSGGACHSGNDGHKHWEKKDTLQTTTITHPPATITGSIQNCTMQNGWCVSPPELALSANEPLAGYSILLIEGTLNGGTFACPSGATSCSLPLNEGENNFNYWALSSWGDSSAMGTSSARVDTVAPSVGLDISGVSGANGWYVSPITVTATGADATSGVASRLLSIDGGATWQPALILNEGVYNAAVSVADNAGNVSSSTTTLSVDTTTPSINMSVAGTLGKNGWYKSAIQVTAAASDATSGVTSFEVSADSAAYQSYTPISFNDGPHTIQFKAVDAAGNVTETAPQTFYVDTLAPTVNLPASWKLGTNVPYDVLDEGSGLAALRIVIEDEDEKYAKVAWNQEVSGSTYSQDIDWNGEFKDKTVAPPGTYLVWIKASDVAGNERFQLGKVIVPETNLFLSLLPTEEPAVAAVPPSPPAELSEPETVLPVTAPPAAGFGGGTTQPGEATTQSVLLAKGSAGAAAATMPSGVLWGTMAAAAIGAASAYALDATRKRKEAEEAQAAQVRAEVARGKAERAEKKQKQQENWNKQHPPQQNIKPPMPTGISPEAQQAYMHGGASAQGWINANVPQLQQAYVKQQKQQKEAAKKWAEKKKAEEAAAKNAQKLAGLSSYRESERQGEKNETVIRATPPMCVAVPEKKKPWWQKVGDWVAPKASYVVDAVVAAQSAWELRHLRFAPLPSGKISVSAPNLPKGTRLNYFKEVVNDDFGFRPGPYKSSTVGSIVKDGLVESAKKSWVTAGLASLVVNGYNYGKDATSLEDFSDKTIENREFWVSTVVDTALAVAVGAVAAVAAAAAVGFVATALAVTAPVTVTIAVAAVIGFGIGWGLDKLGVPNLIKDGINAGMDHLGL